jgi:hypothetical protein
VLVLALVGFWFGKIGAIAAAIGIALALAGFSAGFSAMSAMNHEGQRERPRREVKTGSQRQLLDAEHQSTATPRSSAPGADLREAVLVGALLVNANLREADLRTADLRKADLTGANLTGAYLGPLDDPRDIANKDDQQ